MSNRQIQILLSACVSIYMVVVCFNNLTDYQTNFEFVCGILGMKDTFGFERTGWRAMDGPVLCHLFFITIILWECTVAFFLVRGSIGMLRQRKATSEIFLQAKRQVITGLVLGVLMWFGVFIAIGGEWFLMWQSEKFNGQQTAFFLAIIFLLFLIYLSRAGDE